MDCRTDADQPAMFQTDLITIGLSGVGVAVVNDHEQAVLLADAALEPAASNGAVAVLSRRLNDLAVDDAHALLVSPERITVLRRGQPEPVAYLPAAPILAYYQPRFPNWPVTPRYLVLLAEAWLSDLCYRWSSHQPPAASALAELGILASVAAAGACQVVPDEHGGLRP